MNAVTQIDEISIGTSKSSGNKHHAIRPCSTDDSLSTLSEDAAATVSDSSWGWYHTDSSECGEHHRKVWEGITTPPIPIENLQVTPLYTLNLPRASQALKVFSHGSTLTCCIQGVRICQVVSTGEIRGEYQLSLNFGSRKYYAWKSFSDFKSLVSIVRQLHVSTSHVFTSTLHEWNSLLASKDWFRNVNIKYLVKQSVYISRLVEALLRESPTPGILLDFAQKGGK
mmetsp:Transcript_22201/g.32303  ORF Transcript_22201/g.32303 Transcript_22201/m.32303 type:complete len:226 (-) Transcript_22201:54-731(-)